jgi:NAD(P)-dependent dehydrogenase (short-subunit alcohol dehydrogenase family)
MGRLSGRRVVITGAAGGIGAAAARLFKAEGAALFLTDVSKAPLARLARELNASSCVADVADEKDAARLAREAEAALGSLDGALLNAGIAGAVAMLPDYPIETFDAVMRVNVRGVYLGLKHTIPALKRQGGGSIVITSSYAGVAGVPKIAPYVASKHAIVGLMRAAALECARDNIRINTVNPSPVDTAMVKVLEEGYGRGDPKAARERLMQANPMRRFATPEEVAAMMLFLVSDESRYCTGGVYMVDGGLAAG